MFDLQVVKKSLKERTSPKMEMLKSFMDVEDKSLKLQTVHTK